MRQELVHALRNSCHLETITLAPPHIREPCVLLPICLCLPRTQCVYETRVCSPGTLQTMAKLLKAPEKRVAAVMTLCALVQRCK